MVYSKWLLLLPRVLKFAMTLRLSLRSLLSMGHQLL
jgi:hypothetical protein